MPLPVIYRADLEKELESLTRQREEMLAQIQQIDGAARMCRHLIGKIERSGKAPEPSPEPEPAPEPANEPPAE